MQVRGAVKLSDVACRAADVAGRAADVAGRAADVAGRAADMAGRASRSACMIWNFQVMPSAPPPLCASCGAVPGEKSKEGIQWEVSNSATFGVQSEYQRWLDAQQQIQPPSAL